MGKVEIKIRRKILTPDNLQQYRNYPALLKKYERTKRYKRALRIFLYSLALTMFILALIFIAMWKIILDKKQENSNIYTYSKTIDNKHDTVSLMRITRSINDSIHSITIDYGVENLTDYFQLPVNESFNKWSDSKLVTEKECFVNNQTIKVSKYKRTFGSVSTFCYYTPDIGFIIFYNAASAHLSNIQWKEELIKTGNQEIDKLLPDLTLCIQSDTSFYSHLFL